MGDRLWDQNPPVDPSSSSALDSRSDTMRDIHRRRVRGSREDQLQAELKRHQETLDGLLELRDVPGKRDEILAEERAKRAEHPQWNEVSPALGGAWLKASTWPPEGSHKLDILVVRDGVVVEVVATTIAKYCSHYYDRKTGEYKGSARSPGWGVEFQLMSCRDIFDNPIEIGDAIVLWVAPVEYQGQLVG